MYNINNNGLKNLINLLLLFFFTENVKKMSSLQLKRVEELGYYNDVILSFFLVLS